ncbi:PDZ domain-containing protein [Dyadobacter fanqingshengii]|uniref:PDZ domain-containing protein n=1 Tax=Dyadobacter fanqingshengii TaxID=2906443 RepID=A0A9X1TF30_9BACT|nr:PDZ domain-containing protein [Dyadobacter fanqingshengii]MCF0039127.1 PDZ domain-containing protein [Dyadobacter fanqingshengii]USJ34053.1 PDZ domain-containing protein [Dyadobacter fanqingshengii]
MHSRILGLFLFKLMALAFVSHAQNLYVSPGGNDANAGTLQSPLKTPSAAVAQIKQLPQSKITIFLRSGVYYLDTPLKIDPASLNGKSLTIEAFKNEPVTLSAGRKIMLKWEKHDKNILKAKVSGNGFEMLFINGKQLPIARYPNFDSTARVFNGTAEDALSPARIANSRNIAGGYVHALHKSEWGSFHYRIKGTKNGEAELEGGWQNNRPSTLHSQHRFVENVFSELDAPGEWFLDKKTQTLYLYPPQKLDISKANIEVSHLKHIIELIGTKQEPVKNITISSIRFEHTERTFMEHYEPLLRSDWMIYRGGAVLMENTENCLIKDSEFTNLGGNAVMISGYNVGSGVTGSHIYNIGSSAICFIGDSSAVRSAAFGYENFIPLAKIDRTPGPKNNKYPLKCFAEGNLIHNIGKIEKQCTGVQIEMASEIHVSHNTIYQVPRAGINIGDGAWGGHLIENNDVFETVLETGDHGAFNSWGRDRFWHPDRKTMDSIAATHPELIFLDAQKTVIIRNNRFRCDHGWDVDLDDGSSNYHIYNNVFMSGGLKFREGFQRIAENNVILNNSFHPHVWFKNSGDVFRKNILMRPYFPILIKDWGKEVDYNLFPNKNDLKNAQSNKTDSHSTFGDAAFVDPENGNYQVKSASPALALGFKNFPTDRFGVTKETFKKIAKKVSYPVLLNAALEKDMQEMTWLGVKIRNVRGLGDRSAFGLPDEKGVVVVDVPANSILVKSGLQNNDVVISANKEKTDNVVRLEAIRQQVNWTGQMDVEVLRNQQTLTLKLNLK